MSYNNTCPARPRSVSNRHLSTWIVIVVIVVSNNYSCRVQVGRQVLHKLWPGSGKKTTLWRYIYILYYFSIDVVVAQIIKCRPVSIFNLLTLQSVCVLFWRLHFISLNTFFVLSSAVHLLVPFVHLLSFLLASRCILQSLYRCLCLPPFLVPFVHLFFLILTSRCIQSL